MARNSGSSRRTSRKRSASGSRTSGGGRRKTGGESKAQSKNRAESRSESKVQELSRVTKVTTDHEVIRRWAEERGAKPARVQGTGAKDDIGIIRLEFPGAPGARDEKLEPISWDDWFRKFDESGLAFVYEETTASGQRSNFNKLVKRETVKTRAAHA